MTEVQLSKDISRKMLDYKCKVYDMTVKIIQLRFINVENGNKINNSKITVFGINENVVGLS